MNPPKSAPSTPEPVLPIPHLPASTALKERTSSSLQKADRDDTLGCVEQVLKSALEELQKELQAVAPPVLARGRPPVLPGAVLWTGLLVCILKGFSSQMEIWRLLTMTQLWDLPRYAVSDMAIYQRLHRASAGQMIPLFECITRLLKERFNSGPVSSSPLLLGDSRLPLKTARLPQCITGVVSLDQTTLDPVLRKPKMLRDVPKGDRKLLPGSLSCLFDVLTQQWLKVQFVEDVTQDDRVDAWSMVEALAKGTLVLADLGYFGFAWFDRLTKEGFFYVSRFKEKVTYEVADVLYKGGSSQCYVRDQIVYLGKYRSGKGSHPVRLVEITMPASGIPARQRVSRSKGNRSARGKTCTSRSDIASPSQAAQTQSQEDQAQEDQAQETRTFRYLTNILDPRLLSVAQIVELYRRRWDIEQAFNLIKTHLGLSLLFSSHVNVLLEQVYATFIIAQIVLALRNEIAVRAKADIREVSMELLVRWLPRCAQSGQDPLKLFVEEGRRGGFIRPFRGKEYLLPEIPIESYRIPETFPPPRTPHYHAQKPGECKPCLTANRNTNALSSPE